MWGSCKKINSQFILSLIFNLIIVLRKSLNLFTKILILSNGSKSDCLTYCLEKNRGLNQNKKGFQKPFLLDMV